MGPKVFGLRPCGPVATRSGGPVIAELILATLRLLAPLLLAFALSVLSVLSVTISLPALNPRLVRDTELVEAAV